MSAVHRRIISQDSIVVCVLNTHTWCTQRENRDDLFSFRSKYSHHRGLKCLHDDKNVERKRCQTYSQDKPNNDSVFSAKKPDPVQDGSARSWRGMFFTNLPVQEEHLTSKGRKSNE